MSSEHPELTPNVDVLISLLETFIDAGDWDRARKTGDLMPKAIMKQRLGMMLEDAVEKGLLQSAQAIAKLLDRSLVPEEIEKVIRAYVKQNHLRQAKETAELLPEPLKSQYLSILSS